MPLFGKKKKDKENSSKETINKSPVRRDNSTTSTSNGDSSIESNQAYLRRHKFSFQCQLAHGSPTGLLNGFANIKELYQKIADCYGLSNDDILFCTLNTHKIDMERLLGSHIGLDDFIFVHIKGQKKEVELMKTEESLGLTVTDNGEGKAIVKRIKPGSQMEKLAQGLIEIGDHIEKIDDEMFIGKRHYDVARKLRSISVNSRFTMKLVSPERSIYSNIKPRTEYSTGANPNNIVHGKKTIRFTHSGQIVEEDNSTVSNMDDRAIEIIAGYVEKALGISDQEIATSIFELGKQSSDPVYFSEEINSEMGEFRFPQSLINDFWGVITDAKNGLLSANNNHITGSTQLTNSSSGELTPQFYEERF